MPASKPTEVFRGLTAGIEPVGSEPEVFFTDQSPAFRLTLRNTSENTFVDGCSLRWYLAIGDGMPEPVHTGLVEFELEPEEKTEFVIGEDLLAFAGHGVVGIRMRRASVKNDTNINVSAGRESARYIPLYSFSVWDQSEYESQHEYPLRLQKLAVYLTAGIVVFSILSLLVALINLFVTLINAGMI